MRTVEPASELQDYKAFLHLAGGSLQLRTNVCMIAEAVNRELGDRGVTSEIGGMRVARNADGDEIHRMCNAIVEEKLCPNNRITSAGPSRWAAATRDVVPGQSRARRVAPA